MVVEAVVVAALLWVWVTLLAESVTLLLWALTFTLGHPHPRRPAVAPPMLFFNVIATFVSPQVCVCGGGGGHHAHYSRLPSLLTV